MSVCQRLSLPNATLEHQVYAVCTNVVMVLSFEQTRVGGHTISVKHWMSLRHWKRETPMHGIHSVHISSVEVARSYIIKLMEADLLTLSEL